MLARCARCQGTFQAERFGVLTCPHCGGEIHLADPGGSPSDAPPPPAPPQAAPPPPPSPQAAPPPPTAAERPAEGDLPPPPPPPPGGYGPPFGGPFGGAPGAPPPGGELPAPFAERSHLGFLRAFLDTWKLAAMHPGEFFRRVRIDQTGSAILFGVIASTVGGWAQVLWASMTAGRTRADVAELVARLPPEYGKIAETLTEWAEKSTSTSSLASQAVFAPLAAAVGIFLGAALFHGLLLLVRGANRGFDATLTVVGYASGLSLLQLIPYFGGAVAPLWTAVVLIVGFAEAHRCGTGKGAAAVLLPILLLCACACALAFLAVGALGLGAAAGGAAKAL